MPVQAHCCVTTTTSILIVSLNLEYLLSLAWQRKIEKSMLWRMGSKTGTRFVCQVLKVRALKSLLGAVLKTIQQIAVRA